MNTLVKVTPERRINTLTVTLLPNPKGDLVRGLGPTGCSSHSCQQQEILTESRDKKSVNRNCVDVNTFSMMD